MTNNPRRPEPAPAAFDFQPHLTGTALTLRPYRVADFEPLYALASDRLIWAGHPRPDRHERPVFQAYADQALADRGGLVVLTRPSADLPEARMIGFSRFSTEFVPGGDIEIGWTFLAREFWGGGWNRDLKRTMLMHALAHYPRVIFRVGEANIRSRTAPARIGAQPIPWDELRAEGAHHFRVVAFAITRADFAVGPLQHF